MVEVDGFVLMGYFGERNVIFDVEVVGEEVLVVVVVVDCVLVV